MPYAGAMLRLLGNKSFSQSGPVSPAVGGLGGVSIVALFKPLVHCFSGQMLPNRMVGSNKGCPGHCVAKSSRFRAVRTGGGAGREGPQAQLGPEAGVFWGGQLSVGRPTAAGRWAGGLNG